MSDQKEFLISQLKKTGIRLNWFRKSLYYKDGYSFMKRPQIIGSDDQKELVRFIFSNFSITRKDWRAVK